MTDCVKNFENMTLVLTKVCYQLEKKTVKHNPKFMSTRHGILGWKCFHTRPSSFSVRLKKLLVKSAVEGNTRGERPQVTGGEWTKNRKKKGKTTKKNMA